MRGFTQARTVDRAGFAFLLAMVLFAGSLVTALSATAATSDQPGNPGTSNSASHGNEGNSESNSNSNGSNEGQSESHGKSKGNSGNEGKSSSHGKSKGSNGNEGQSESHGKSKGNSDKGNSNGNSKGNDNSKGKGKGHGKGGKKDEELPDVIEEPSTPDEVLGARLVATRLLLTYKNRAFRGRVLSRRDRCVSGRTVTVKRRNGTVIGRDKTNKRGRFSISAPRHAGRFKARAGRKSFIRKAADLKVVCLADRSRLRIKAL